jgi:hypothetical protein
MLLPCIVVVFARGSAWSRTAASTCGGGQSGLLTSYNTSAGTNKTAYQPCAQWRKSCCTFVDGLGS